MKCVFKYVASLVCLISISGFSFAQTHYSSNIAVGVKAGIDFSKILFTPSVEQNLLPGIIAGLTFRYIEENHFGLIAEMIFQQRGWEDDLSDSNYKYSRRLNYLQIPVMAHIYFGRRAKFFINAGPEIGFRLSESTDCNFNPDEIASLPQFPYENRNWQHIFEKSKQKIDYGISGGIGGEFNINPRNAVYIEGRFYYGLGNLFKSGRKDPFSSSNSMSIMLSLGYWFRIH